MIKATPKSRQKLTPKQARFCVEYLRRDGDASAAYRAAYDCERMSNESVWVAASELLRHPLVSVRVAELRSKVDKRAEVSLVDVANLLGDAIMADVTDYVTPSGTLRAEDIKAMSVEKRRLISSITATRDGVKITFIDKVAAADRLAKLRGWDAPDKREHTISTIDTSSLTPEALAALAALGRATFSDDR